MGAIQDFRATIRTRKFCFCLPVRLGVFVVSLITMTVGAIIGAIGWMQVVSLRQHPVELGDEIGAYIHASMFSLLGLLSVFGFVGSLVRQRGLVVAYSVGIAIHLGLSFASGIFAMYNLFKPSSQNSIEECLKAAGTQGDSPEETKRICETGSAIAKGIIVAIYVITWLLQIYAFFVIERYAEQLEEEEMAKIAAIMPQQPHQPMAYVGYPHRFSYGYSERGYDGNRAYYEDGYLGPQGGQDPYGQPTGQAPEYERRRPTSQEYAFQLQQQQPLGSARPGKEASNMV